MTNDTMVSSTRLELEKKAPATGRKKPGAAKRPSAAIKAAADLEKHRLIAEMLQDIRTGIDQLAANAEARRSRWP